LFFATKEGQVKKTPFNEYDSSRRDGLIALKLRPKDELVRVIETSGSDDVFMVTRDGQTIRFSEKGVRPMGRSAAGVRGMKLRATDEVVSCDVAKDDSAILIITESGYGKRTDDDIVVVASGGTTIRTPVKEISSQGRAATGVRIMSMDDGQVVASAALVLSHDEA